MSQTHPHSNESSKPEVAPHATAVEPALFREAMSKLGAAVHVVTSAGPAGQTGFTATAVCSVCDTPATVLVCLNRGAVSAPQVTENGVFCVNTLVATDESVADAFAGRKGTREERFSTREWTTLTTGSPVLTTAAIAFDCRIVEIKTVASHYVIFGAVEAIRLGPASEALVYHERAYKRV